MHRMSFGGGCFGEGKGMSPPHRKVTLERRPVGHAGVSHAGIWGRVFHAEEAAPRNQVAGASEWAEWLSRG